MTKNVPDLVEIELTVYDNVMGVLVPPFQKSRNASPQSTMTRSLGSFLADDDGTLRRHLQETEEPNQAFLLFF